MPYSYQRLDNDPINTRQVNTRPVTQVNTRPVNTQPDLELIPLPESSQRAVGLADLLRPNRFLTRQIQRNIMPTNNSSNQNMDNDPNNGGTDNGGTVQLIPLQIKINPFLLFGVVVLLYIALSLWARAGEQFIFSGLLNNRSLKWWQLALIALGVSGLILLVLWISGVTVVQLQSEI